MTVQSDCISSHLIKSELVQFVFGGAFLDQRYTPLVVEENQAPS